MHIHGEDWPLLVVETLSPISGVVRYMLVVMSTRLPLVVKTFLPNPGVIRYMLVVMSIRLPVVVMMCAILLYALWPIISSNINASLLSTTHCTCLCMTGRVDNLTSNPRWVGYLLVWMTIRLE